MKKYAKRILYQTSNKMFSLLKDYHFSFFSDNYFIKNIKAEISGKDINNLNSDSDVSIDNEQCKLF